MNLSAAQNWSEELSSLRILIDDQIEVLEELAEKTCPSGDVRLLRSPHGEFMIVPLLVAKTQVDTALLQLELAWPKE